VYTPAGQAQFVTVEAESIGKIVAHIARFSILSQVRPQREIVDMPPMDQPTPSRELSSLLL
jgi:hypothetical protein